MPQKICVGLVFEDALQEAVLEKILNHFGDRYWITSKDRRGGRSRIQNKIKDYNQAAKYSRYIVLIDLDTNECAPSLITEWLGDQVLEEKILIRVAVRSVESWLMADGINLAEFLRVNRSKFNQNPDDLVRPKVFLIDAARRSRNRTIREGIVPPNQFRQIGPNYNALLTEFVQDCWNVEEAIRNSESLSRFVKRLKTF